MKQKKYPKLPVMQCEPNCGECCTIVPASRVEFDAISNYAEARGIEPINQGTQCPWYQNGGCSVHPVRPTLCRLFGHVPDMKCPRGHNVNITRKEEKRWKRIMRDGTMFLHEIIPGWTPERARVRPELIAAVTGRPTLPETSSG